MAPLINKFIQSPCSCWGQSSALLSPISTVKRGTINKVSKNYLRSRGINLMDKSERFANKLSLKNTKISVRPACKRKLGILATLTREYTPDKSSESAVTSFTLTYPLRRAVKIDGKITVKSDSVSGDGKLRLILESDLPGRWVLHWGVAYSDDPNSEWDQPPPDMRPPGSVLIKDYAVQTPLAWATSPVEGQTLSRVQIGINNNDSIAAILFVLKDEDTGTWYDNNGEDFRVHLAHAIPNSSGKLNDGMGLRRWPGFQRCEFEEQPHLERTWFCTDFSFYFYEKIQKDFLFCCNFSTDFFGSNMHTRKMMKMLFGSLEDEDLLGDDVQARTTVDFSLMKEVLTMEADKVIIKGGI